jgi:hypothetical protein
MLGLPYGEEYGGGGQPYEVYLQALEALAAGWGAVALAVSVHTMSCYPLATFGTEEQKQRWLPDMLGGELLGAYCLSEAQSGSDAGSLQAKARQDGDKYVLNGTKAWVTHGGVADYYVTFARTSDDAKRGISTLLIPADTPGVLPQPPERKMGLLSSPTASIGCWATRGQASRSHCQRWTTGDSASLRSRPASPKPRSTQRSPGSRSVSSSACRSRSSRV